MIVKTKKGYKVISHTSGKSFGTYKRKSDAVKRLLQIKLFGKSK